MLLLIIVIIMIIMIIKARTVVVRVVPHVQESRCWRALDDRLAAESIGKKSLKPLKGRLTKDVKRSAGIRDEWPIDKSELDER